MFLLATGSVASKIAALLRSVPVSFNGLASMHSVLDLVKKIHQI